MKLEEFIEKLKGYDQELVVMVDGYEGGYWDDLEFTEAVMMLNVRDGGYEGPHEKLSNKGWMAGLDKKDAVIVDALIIGYKYP